MIKTALREPLLHFLVAGLLLFVLFELLSTDDNEGARSIVVDEGDLVLFARHRYGKFGPEEAETWVRELGAGTLKDVIDDFVHEETLFREAKALQLDRDDYTGRQRLISQLEFINRGFIRDNLKLSDADLQSFYSANRDRYFIPAKITFAHVFFSMNLHDDQTEALARSQHQSLNHDNIQFNSALTLGDRFLYHRYYVNKERDEISSHFGKEFASQVFELAVDNTLWVGPLRSTYGYHLVMIASKSEAHFPSLAAVAARVEEDALVSRVKQELDRIHSAIMDGYQIVLAEQLSMRLEEKK